jgi:hypothetical protein
MCLTVGIVRLGEGLSLQQTTGSRPRGSQVCELLGIYQELLDTISDLPLVPMVLWRHGGRLHYVPRPRWLLRYFMVRHIDRMLASLSRRYSARAALGWAADAEPQDREAVREFQQSLPPTRHNTYFVLLIIAIVILYRPIINTAVPVAINLTETTTGRSELRQQVLDTVEKVGAALTANFTSVNQALNALLSGGLLHLGIVTLGVALSLYVVLRPCVPAFRLKRMLFNLAPEPEGQYRSAVAQWSVSQATGVYERERRVLAELGGRPPRELPFDLIVPALVMLLPLAWGSLLFRLTITSSLSEWEWILFLSLGACLLVPALIRLGWLYRTWQHRQLGRSGPYMPFEVRIRSGSAAATVERPLGVRMLFFVWIFIFIVGTGWDPESSILDSLAFGLLGALIVSLLVNLPWWYRINRELRDLDQAYDPRKPRNEPRWSLLMMTAGWLVLLPPFITVFRTSRHIQKAQARAGQPEGPLPAWLLAPWLLLHPVLFSYLQHELNKVWAAEGEPLDPWPNTSRKVECSTMTMPWLKEAYGRNHRTGRSLRSSR